MNSPYRPSAVVWLLALVGSSAPTAAQPAEIVITDQVAPPVAATDHARSPTPDGAFHKPALPVPMLGTAPHPEAPQVIVVCPPTLLPALARWIDYRQQQGYRIVQIDGRLTAVEILTTIRKFARSHRLNSILLVGDGDLDMQHDPQLRGVCVPTFLVNARINSELGAEPHLATDNPYADLDGDQVPDVPIGRISVESKAQLRQVVEKIISYEQLPRAGEWRRTIHLAAGVGDFGALADAVIETATKKMLADGIPAEYHTTMTYGNWRSPFCPDPRSFREHMLSHIENGCLFWVYMGHGRARRLDRFQVGNHLIPVLESTDVPRFRATRGLPIAVLLACYTGAFDQPKDCLAEQLLRTGGGPVAVLAASRVTLPYSMSILGAALMDGAFAAHTRGNGQPPLTLGEVVLHGKRGLAFDSGGKNRKLIDSLARTLSPTREKLPEERQEHQLLFNLFGDPLLRIEQPRQIEVTSPQQAKAGQTLVIRGMSPIAGRCTVELVCRRDRLTFSPPHRRSLSSSDSLLAMNEVYRRANDARWNHREIDLQAGRFAIELDVPASARGPSFARLMISSANDFALGSSYVYIQPPVGQSDLRTSNAER